LGGSVSYYEFGYSLIAILLLGVFWIWGLAPTFHWLDTSELVSASASLGIGHPPGQPTHVLWGAIMQWIPFGDAGFRGSLASIVPMLGSVILLRPWIRNTAREPRSPVFLTCAVLAVGLSSIVALQALRPEVYGLAAFLTVFVITLGYNQKDCRKRYMAWFVWGLAMATHPVIAISSLPFLLWRRGVFEWTFGALGSMVWIFLPLRAAQNPAWNFGHPINWDRFIWFVRGDLYKAYDEPSWSTVIANMKEAAFLFTSSITPGGVLLCLFGLSTLWFFSRKVAVPTTLAVVWSIGTLVAMGNFWSNNPDASGYLGVVAWFAMAWAVSAFSLGEQYTTKGWGRAILSVLAIVWVLAQVHGFIRGGNLRGDWSAHRHASSLLAEPTASAAIHSGSFSTYSLLRYGQIVEGRRPDIEVLYRGMPSIREAHRLSVPKENVWWELAIHRNSSGYYGIREEDVKRVKELAPAGWFYRIGGLPQKHFVNELRYRTLEVQANMVPGMDYEHESLILNYLLHIALARRQNERERAEALSADLKMLFPNFDHVDALEKMQ